MPTVTKIDKPSDARGEPAGNQGLAEPRQDHLRDLVFNYIYHNCYLKTAKAFVKDSAVRHLDKDGDEIPVRVGDDWGILGSQAPSSELSDEMVQNILLRQRIQFEILSGNVKQATVLLNRHFPKVLAEDGSENETETDENVNPSRLEYIGETLNPIHLSLNLRILAFIEACRTIPLVYTPSSRAPGSFISSDSEDVASVAVTPIKDDQEDKDSHTEELLYSVQKLRASVNALRKSDDHAVYDRELSNVGGLLAYAVPEHSPMAKYLHQERRDRVAEQINNAILYHTNMPSVSYLELAVRYTQCLWATLHELRVKVPAAHQPGGVSLPIGTSLKDSSEPEKESSLHEARPFDLQLFLNSKA